MTGSSAGRAAAGPMFPPSKTAASPSRPARVRMRWRGRARTWFRMASVSSYLLRRALLLIELTREGLVGCIRMAGRARCPGLLLERQQLAADQAKLDAVAV